MHCVSQTHLIMHWTEWGIMSYAGPGNLTLLSPWASVSLWVSSFTSSASCFARSLESLTSWARFTWGEGGEEEGMTMVCLDVTMVTGHLIHHGEGPNPTIKPIQLGYHIFLFQLRETYTQGQFLTYRNNCDLQLLNGLSSNTSHIELNRVRYKKTEF